MGIYSIILARECSAMSLNLIRNYLMTKYKFWSGEEIKAPDSVLHKNCILVVGSNPTGWHGAGLAKVANLYWGAEYYKGRGLSGRTYLLPTKNLKRGFYEESSGITYHKTGFRSLSPEQIKANIVEMYSVAKSMPESLFVVPYKRNDRNLNGYTSQFMFDLFTRDIDVPVNIVFHSSWKDVLSS